MYRMYRIQDATDKNSSANNYKYHNHFETAELTKPQASFLFPQIIILFKIVGYCRQVISNLNVV